MASSIPKRKLGRSDEQVSALGMGGHHLGDAKSYAEADWLAHRAIDGGVTFFDNCWEYWEGRSEDWLGRALKGRRDEVFLMTKVCSHGRDKKLALQMLDESLQRLQTDHLDLWQIHGVGFDGEPEEHFRKGGDAEALLEAKQAGKVRYIGFTGHKSPEVHLRMLQSEFPFDTVQMPLNAFDGQFRSFEQLVLPKVNALGMGAIGMKSMGGSGQPVLGGVIRAEEALRYAMSLPVAVTVSGMETLEVLRQNLGVARGLV